jgi:hypothetical protein
MTYQNTSLLRTSIISLSATLLTSLTACQSASDSTTPSPTVDRAAADIGDLRNNGKQVQSIVMPEGFKQGDKIVAYEGPGWESDKVAYRIYLDGRNALDIFGKKTAPMVLSTVGRGDDYHKMADWGMDILKVGNSLGAGGFGVFENGVVRQIGNAENYGAEIVNDTNEAATVKVTHYNSQSCGGDVAGYYTTKAGEYMTHIRVEGDCALPYAAGLVMHKDTSSMASGGNAGWQYIAQFGEQSLVPDSLGMAIFYKAEDVVSVGKDSDDHYIVFKDGQAPRYATAAIWAQDASGIDNASDFMAWLNKTQASFENGAAH